MTNDEIKTQIQTAQNELKALTEERKLLLEKLEQTDKETEASQPWRDLNNIKETAYKKWIKALNEQDAESTSIASEYLKGSYVRSNRASWSNSFGKNIEPHVIEGIKKTFQWGKLSGGAIEDIVNRMITHNMDASEKLTQLRADTQATRTVYHIAEETLRNFERKCTEEINGKIKESWRSIDAKEKEIDRLTGQLDVTEMKRSDLDGATRDGKSRALNNYRDKCIEEYEKVFANLPKEYAKEVRA